MMKWTIPRGVSFSQLAGGVFDPVTFELSGKAIIQDDARLGVGGGSGIV